jgi:hypothetical protein
VIATSDILMLEYCPHGTVFVIIGPKRKGISLGGAHVCYLV